MTTTQNIALNTTQNIALNITLAQAETITAAARALADERGVVAAFAVVDTGGNLVAFARTDGANLVTIDTAIGKAFTAVSIGGDSVNLTPAIRPGGPLFGTGLVLAGARSLVPYGGGVHRLRRRRTPRSVSPG